MLNGNEISYKNKFIKKEEIKNQEKIESGLNIGFAKKYLKMTSEIGYYEGINSNTSESLVLAKSKLEPLKRFLPNPKDIVSIGVGAGEELHALADLYANEQTTIHGLDVSSKSISVAKEQLAKYKLKLNMIEGSAIDLPFNDHSIDGIIESSILHEIYSYVPDGKNAWKKTIDQVALKLSENGIYLLRDFSAPSNKKELEMNLTSDIAKKFYNYFREYYRTFAQWEEKDIKNIIDKRIPNDLDFPPYQPQSHTVTLPFGMIAEVILHFRNFYDNYIKGITTLGNPHWKEINESYLPPNPNLPNIHTMPRNEYVETVLVEANKALKNTEYEMICVQNELSTRPKIVKFLADHFTLSTESSDKDSDELLSEVTEKMELVFKKIKKRLSYKLNSLEIAQAVAEKGKINVVTPNNLNLILENGVFIPDLESFKFIEVLENLVKASEPIETIADIGTGSGVIAISMGKTFKDKVIYAYDTSPNALIIARQNAQQNDVSNIKFLLNTKKEWTNSVSPAKIDFIVSNPPYVGDDEFNSPEFKKLYPDYQYQPETSIRSYDREGMMPYVSIIEIAQIHKTKYILFRVNPAKINALIHTLNATTQMNIEKVQSKNGKEEFLFITLI